LIDYERINDAPYSLKKQFYEQMYTIRLVEESLLHLFSKGLLTGTTHTCIGQEACAVGVVNALDKEKDIIFSNHRGHGHFIAYCDKVEELIAELMGRATGVCGGIGGSQHLHFKNFFSSGIQGGLVPCAAGVALAEKVKGTRAIVTVFLGDGTMGQGVVYETFNIASKWSLPLLFILENNWYAQTTPRSMAIAGKLVERAKPFNIDSYEMEAFDVIKVFLFAKKIVKFVRDNSRPFLLVLNTYRLAPHSKGDDTRPPKEIDKYRKRDPLPKLRKSLNPKDVEEIEKRAKTRIRMAIEKAKSSPIMNTKDFFG